jgi:hydrogenase nickel incorporation protein HypA/HybF
LHEYSLVQALVSRVEAEARQRQALKIHGLTVRLGELSGVDPGLFQTAFETFRAGTLCEGATLKLTRIPASWACPRCRRPIPRGEVLRCPDCDVPAQLDDDSDALTLDSVDMEVP